uniref:Uncharacterized protein n=1 Tax=Rhizophora mucronata TaxID=61149 RepID=A0A2P2MHD1_RHIMU
MIFMENVEQNKFWWNKLTTIPTKVRIQIPDKSLYIMLRR